MLCYAIQVDGSSDRSNKDNKFITARYIPKENSAEILTVFLGVISPEDYGANGLLTATTTILNQIGLCTGNLVGVTTDGEAANTGKNTGLWKLLQNHVGHKLLTVWCTCHRSDLAMELVISSVPEMKIWLMNLTSIASYFHTAPLKTKLLKQKFGEEKKFVNFQNILRCLTARDSATRKLDLILDGPIPGGMEDKYLGLCDIDVDEDTNNIENVNDVPAQEKIIIIEKSIIHINFLCQRLNVEEDETTSQMIKLISANSCKEMREAGCQLVENIFGHDKVLEFVNNVTDFWPMTEDIPNIDTTDKGTQYSLKLRTIAVKTSGILQKLFVTLLIVFLHSITTERVISHYNQIKTIHKIILLEETINYRLYVSLNGVGTAFYDPRPAVIAFLNTKERRYREPDLCTYKNRDFINKFFRKKKPF
ncbi:hypothetical protein QTP88_028118 [Uroleucon formosanum]